MRYNGNGKLFFERTMPRTVGRESMSDERLAFPLGIVSFAFKNHTKIIYETLKKIKL